MRCCVNLLSCVIRSLFSIAACFLVAVIFEASSSVNVFDHELIDNSHLPWIGYLIIASILSSYSGYIACTIGTELFSLGIGTLFAIIAPMCLAAVSCAYGDKIWQPWGENTNCIKHLEHASWQTESYLVMIYTILGVISTVIGAQHVFLQCFQKFVHSMCIACA